MVPTSAQAQRHTQRSSRGRKDGDKRRGERGIVVGDRAGSSRTQSSSNPNKGKVTRTALGVGVGVAPVGQRAPPFFLITQLTHLFTSSRQAGSAPRAGREEYKDVDLFLNQELVISHSLLISRQVPREEERGTLACNAHHHASRRPC